VPALAEEQIAFGVELPAVHEARHGSAARAKRWAALDHVDGDSIAGEGPGCVEPRRSRADDRHPAFPPAGLDLLQSKLDRRGNPPRPSTGQGTRQGRRVKTGFELEIHMQDEAKIAPRSPAPCIEGAPCDPKTSNRFHWDADLLRAACAQQTLRLVETKLDGHRANAARRRTRFGCVKG